MFPAALLSTNDIDGDYQRLKRLGVKFRGKPKKDAIDDTCGNFIVLYQSDA